MLSIAIVTYNSEASVKSVIDSLIEHLPNTLDPEIIIIDNASTDETVSVIRGYVKQLGNITLISNPKNVGFGKAHNQALALVSSRYHVVCNPDIFFGEDVFTALKNLMENSKDIGVLCPRFCNPDGTVQHLNRRFPTVLDLFLRRIVPGALKPLFKKRFESYDMRDAGYEHSYDVPFVSGAFMFCRTHVLKEVGGFDERFFLYFEDADLSRRVQNHGYRTVYFPDVSVTHVWERLAHKSLHGSWMFVRSAYLYFRKWGFKWL